MKTKLHYFMRFSVFVCFMITAAAQAQKVGQVIKMPKKEKQQNLLIAYRMDHFYLDPKVVMNELIWQNKFSESSNYAEEIKYLRMAYEKIEYTYGQKEFRNQAETKIYHHVLKLLPKLISEGKVYHIDRHTKKPSVMLNVTICEEKAPGYALITTQKGKVIFDCDGNYLPQAK